ncbi:MAG: class I SAM-dependent methyltransferase [Elusimicrobia bacterium]|nr:class I SAM-dependent methyltransferase [Elusimicrobiota bacterium]
MRRKPRGRVQLLKDFVTFPLRALTLFHNDRWGLSALSSERFEYVGREVRGRCLDVGCGRSNRFVQEFLGGHGKGIDVFRYEGLARDEVVADLCRFPFPDASFDSVTFIANLNHVPRSKRDIELAEAWRCLKPGGDIVVTMGNPVAEILVHQVVWLYDKVFRTDFDMDTERGMAEGEEYFLRDAEIVSRLARAGFCGVRKKYFPTQWALNHLFVASKPV